MVLGIVVDDGGFGFFGVNILVKGISMGIVIDLDGNYFVDIEYGVVFVFFYIGYVV